MLSEQLKAFIRAHLPTIWALQVLILLCRNQDRAWTPDEVNRELRGSMGLVLDVLSRFDRAKLVVREANDIYRWLPSTAETVQLSEELISIYTTHPLAVIRVITEAQTERIQTLADAFKMKKD